MIDANEPVEIRTTRSNDWTGVIVGSVAFLAGTFTLATSSAADWQTAQGIRREWLYLLFERVVGVMGVRIFFVGFVLAFGLNALGAAWRLRDGRIALRADSSGLTFHPSFRTGSLSWSDVDSIRINSGLLARITIRLKRRFWSVTHPFTGRDVQLNLRAIGSSHRSAESAARKMQEWLRD
jgi:hypothetical protein